MKDLDSTRRNAALAIVAGLVLLFIPLSWPIYGPSLRYFAESFLGGRTAESGSLYWTSAGFVFLIRIVTKNPVFSGMLLIRGALLGL